MPLPTLPPIPPLDEILSKMNLFCESGKTIVGVYVNVGGKPIQGVNLKLYVGSPIPFAPLIELKGKYTNYAGVIGYCVTNRQYAEAWIQKSGMDFGSGKEVWHKLGAVTGVTRGLFVPKPYVFKHIGEIDIPSIPDIPDICTAWETAANVSLPIQFNALSTIVNIYNAKWNCPNLNTSDRIDGIGILKIGSFSTNFKIDGGLAFFDLKDKLDLSTILRSLAGVRSTNVEILIPNKDIGYTTFTKSISMPVADIIPDICTTWDTVATPNVPATMATSFPISVSSAKWVCKDFDGAEMISGIGKIEIGGYTFDLPIQNGYGRVYLEDLMDLSTFTGLPTAPTTPTISIVPIVPETIIPPDISPYEPGSSTITLYLNDYLRRGIYTPIRGAYWGAGYFSRSTGSYTIHKAEDASGTGDKYGIPCKLNVPKTHQYFGEYTVTVLSVQNLGLENASYTVKIKL